MNHFIPPKFPKKEDTAFGKLENLNKQLEYSNLQVKQINDKIANLESRLIFLEQNKEKERKKSEKDGIKFNIVSSILGGVTVLLIEYLITLLSKLIQY